MQHARHAGCVSLPIPSPGGTPPPAVLSNSHQMMQQDTQTKSEPHCLLSTLKSACLATSRHGQALRRTHGWIRGHRPTLAHAPSCEDDSRSVCLWPPLAARVLCTQDTLALAPARPLNSQHQGWSEFWSWTLVSTALVSSSLSCLQAGRTDTSSGHPSTCRLIPLVLPQARLLCLASGAPPTWRPHLAHLTGENEGGFTLAQVPRRGGVSPGRTSSAC